MDLQVKIINKARSSAVLVAFLFFRSVLCVVCILFPNIKNIGSEGDNLDLWIWNFLRTMLKLITWSSFATFLSKKQKVRSQFISTTKLFFWTSDILCLCIREASLLARILHLRVVNSRGQAYSPVFMNRYEGIFKLRLFSVSTFINTQLFVHRHWWDTNSPWITRESLALDDSYTWIWFLS